MTGARIIEGAKEALAIARGEAKPSRLHIYRYCPHERLDEALALGWRKSADLHQPHGTFSVLVEYHGVDDPQWFDKSRGFLDD